MKERAKVAIDKIDIYRGILFTKWIDKITDLSKRLPGGERQLVQTPHTAGFSLVPVPYPVRHQGSVYPCGASRLPCAPLLPVPLPVGTAWHASPPLLYLPAGVGLSLLKTHTWT